MNRFLCLLSLLAMAFSGCTSDDAGVTPPLDDEGRYVIRMTDQLTFDPPVATVPRGATVVWTNNASVDHDVAAYRGDPIKEDREEFSSTRVDNQSLMLIGPGGQYNHTFSEKGSWTIWCHTHHEQRMKGVIRVA